LVVEASSDNRIFLLSEEGYYSRRQFLEVDYPAISFFATRFHGKMPGQKKPPVISRIQFWNTAKPLSVKGFERIHKV
jgi:hypothetical protein